MNIRLKQILCFVTAILLSTIIFLPTLTLAKEKNTQYVIDDADVLTSQEIKALEKKAKQYSEKRETDFLIITTNDSEKDIIEFVQDFYDDKKPGYDKEYGNTAILAINMEQRDFYLAGFKKAEKKLNDERLDLINEKITPYLVDGDYFEAFDLYLDKAYQYINVIEGMNPENILFKTSYQFLIALIVGTIIIAIMIYRPSARTDVTARTYHDHDQTQILRREDRYIRTTVTKQKKPSSDDNPRSGGGGFGGGGGVTRGGHSHSGSRGSF